MGRGLEFFVQKSSNIMAENRLLKFVVVILAVSIVYLGTMIRYAMDSQRTIIVPPVVTTSLSLRGDQADDAYLVAMARYIAALVFNYTPATAQRQFTELMHLYSPETFSSGQLWLSELVATVEKARVTSVYYPESISIADGEINQIKLEGTLKRGTDLVEPTGERVVYLIDYRIVAGRFEILQIVEKVRK